MANILYNSAKKDLITGAIDLDTDTIKAMLVTSTYSPNMDTHTKKSDVTNEVSGTGYTAGGVTLASITVTQDNTNDKAVFDAADLSWSTATITARGLVIYKDTGTGSTSPLLCYLDFGSDVASTAGTFSVQFSSSGILALS